MRGRPEALMLRARRSAFIPSGEIQFLSDLSDEVLDNGYWVVHTEFQFPLFYEFSEVVDKNQTLFDPGPDVLELYLQSADSAVQGNRAVHRRYGCCRSGFGLIEVNRSRTLRYIIGGQEIDMNFIVRCVDSSYFLDRGVRTDCPESTFIKPLLDECFFFLLLLLLLAWRVWSSYDQPSSLQAHNRSHDIP